MFFLVYGYMNRGPHEGFQGISLCRYDSSGAIEERFFIPSTESYDEIRLDIEKGRAEIDYSIVSLLRGQGYGTVLLEQALKRAVEDARRREVAEKEQKKAKRKFSRGAR